MKFIMGLLVFLTNNCLCQCNKSQRFDTSLFERTLNKQTDTIYFKATYVSFGKIVQADYINKLNAKRSINKKNYSSAIEFIPLGSTQELYLPFNEFYDKKIYDKLRDSTVKNQTICIRGIVYKGYEKWHKSIFFIVDRIDF